MADPTCVTDAESESRTASVSRGKRSLPSISATPSNPSMNSSPRSASSGKRKRSQKRVQDLRDLIPMGATFSKSAELLETSAHTNTDPSNPPPAVTPKDDANADSIALEARRLGKNRLARGFAAKAPSTSTDDPIRTSSLSSMETGTFRDDAIEISDSDEEMGSDGGMIVNLDKAGKSKDIADSDQDQALISSDDGEIFESRSRSISGGEQALHTTRNANSVVHLVDLSPEDLEDELKYGLYHLDRSQIDLNRPVVCLTCFIEGHMSADCPSTVCGSCNSRHLHSSTLCPITAKCSTCRQRGHAATSCTTGLKNTTASCELCGSKSHIEQSCAQRFFVPNQAAAASVKLWISCSCCASKSHLIGDCPDASPSASARWSLKALDPAQITNLSLETGMRRLEKEAENRGMRPSGLQIKGRAGLHQATASKYETKLDDEDGSFIRPRVGRRDPPAHPQVRLGNHDAHRPEAATRYDRFEAPSFDSRSSGRGHGSWHMTDSFGRRRSRSRSPATDRYRPGDRRPPSPRRFNGMAQTDSYHPQGHQLPPSDYWRQQPSSGLSQSAQPSRYQLRSNSDASVGAPPSNLRAQLPTRQGSNPNLKSTYNQGNKTSSGNGPATSGKQLSKNQRKKLRAQKKQSDWVSSDEDGREGQEADEDVLSQESDVSDTTVQRHELYVGNLPVEVTEKRFARPFRRVRDVNRAFLPSRSSPYILRGSTSNLPDGELDSMYQPSSVPHCESIYTAKMDKRHMLQDVTVNGFPDVKVHLKHPVPTHETVAQGYDDHNIPSKLRTWYATENAVRRQNGKAPLSFILADGKAACHGYIVDTDSKTAEAISLQKYNHMSKVSRVIRKTRIKDSLTPKQQEALGKLGKRLVKDDQDAYLKMHNEQRSKLGLRSLEYVSENLDRVGIMDLSTGPQCPLNDTHHRLVFEWAHGDADEKAVLKNLATECAKHVKAQLSAEGATAWLKMQSEENCVEKNDTEDERMSSDAMAEAEMGKCEKQSQRSRRWEEQKKAKRGQKTNDNLGWDEIEAGSDDMDEDEMEESRP